MFAFPTTFFCEIMKNLPDPINTNKEYITDNVSVTCEVSCDFEIMHTDADNLKAISSFVEKLPLDEAFMNELGVIFVKLVERYVALNNET